MTELAKLCIYYRARNRLTQQELAQKCGLNRASIINIEKDRGCSALTEAKIRIVVEGDKRYEV